MPIYYIVNITKGYVEHETTDKATAIEACAIPLGDKYYYTENVQLPMLAKWHASQAYANLSRTETITRQWFNHIKNNP